VRRTLLLASALVTVGSACSSSPSRPTAISGATPVAFHIDYRASDLIGGTATPTRVRWWVRRPFEGRREVRAGTSLSGTLVSLAVTSFGRSLTQSAGSDALVLAVPPQPPVADLRRTLVASKGNRALSTVGTRTISGRTCIRYRMPTSVANGGPVQGRATAANHTDLCIDGQSLVLARTDVAGGKQVHDEEAITVRTGATAVQDDLFATPAPTLDLQHGGGFIRPVDPSSRPPGTFYELAAPPAGFTLKGRYATAPPQPENYRTDNPTTRAARVAGVVDVYVRGPDFIAVDRGGTLGGVAPFAADPKATRIDLGSLGTGELVENLLVTNARVALAGGHYLRVVGTASPESMYANLLRDLEPQPGGQLVYLDGP